MKILFQVNSLTGGGAERVCVCLANGLHKLGHNVTIFTDVYNKPYTYKVNDGIKIIQREDYTVKHIKLNIIKRKFIVTKQLWKLYRKEQFDIVICIMPLLSITAFICSLGLKTKIILSEHNSFERPSSAPFRFSDYLQKFYGNFLYDAITVLTKRDYNLIKNRFKQVYVMPNPLFLTPLEFNVKERKNIVLAVGRVYAYHCKGFDLLIRAWAKIKNQVKGWKLEIAGLYNKESYNLLYNLSIELGVSDSIIFLGRCEDMKTLYQNASIFCLSSRYEGFGLVLIEAMSQGCACIACDYLSRQSDIITSNKQGLICKAGDIDALSKSLLLMINDHSYRESVRINAIERSKFYNQDKISLRWEKLLYAIYNNKKISNEELD